MPRGRYSIRSVSNDGARLGGFRRILELGWFGLGSVVVAHGQSVYPCHEDGIQFGPYRTTALDEVGCDVFLSWVGLVWVR